MKIHISGQALAIQSKSPARESKGQLPSPDGLAGSVEPALPRRPRLPCLALQAAQPDRPTPLLRDSQPAVDFVHRFNSELKLPPDTLQRRNEMTVSSPAKFYRVNPALFYDDVLGVYFNMSNLLDPRKAPEIIIAGDCHLGNFGTLRARDGSTFWGINDFDMAGKGTPEDDLERMATSLHLMSPLSTQQCNELIADMAEAYLNELQRMAACGSSEHGGITQGEAHGVVADLIAKKSQETQASLLKEFTKNGHFKRNKELREVTPPERELVEGFLANYESKQGDTPELKRPLQVLDIAAKMESGGSTYGLNRFFILVAAQDGEPRILDMKQELPTAPEQNTGDTEEADADYIFSCMKALGGTFDPTMAAGTMDKDAYYIRERQREKGSLPISEFTQPQQWRELVENAAVAVARAHAYQSGAAQAITDWVGDDRPTLIERLQSFAQVYAQQTVEDRAAYKESLT
ncbi:DUF2252 family protein [bacterium]|nr:DUF2252 family protein [bacterium]